MHIRHALATLFTALALTATANASASHSQHNLFPQHDYSRFALPEIGTTSVDVANSYGTPAKIQKGANGMDIWDYGTFRVMFHNDSVKYASLW